MKKLAKSTIIAIAALALCGGALVACGGKGGSSNAGNSSVVADDVPEALKEAVNYVKALYKSEAEETPSTYIRPKQVTIGETVFPLTWTAESTPAGAVTVIAEEGNELAVRVSFDTMTSTEIPYVLSVNVATPDGSATYKMSWNKKVPAFKEATWAEYAAAEKDTVLVVKGVVNGIISKSRNGNSSNSLYFQDKDGGYYAYNMSDDPATLGINIGDTVRVTGKKDNYNGTYEIVPTSVEKLNDAPVTLTADDYTEIFKKAETTKDADLTKYQAKLVTIKGVTIKNAGDNGYYNWELAGKTSYTRISSSSCPLTKAEQTAFINGFNEHQGWTADVTGLVTLYSGAFYLTPVDANAIKYVSLPEKSDAEAVAFEKDALTLETEFTSAKEVEVPSKGGSYEKVAISWASADESVIKFEGGKMKVTMPSETKEVKVTATLKAGETTDTKEFTVKCVVSNSFISQALDVCDALENKAETTDKYMIFGTVSEITTAYSAQYKNVSFNLTDGARSILVYRYALDDAESIKAGDFLALKGTLQKYNTTLEFKNAEKIENAMDLATANEKSTAGDTSNAVVYGQISKINTAYSAQYKNISFTISDGTNEFYCYRVAGGEDLKLGDAIVVSGKLGAYNGKGQLAAGGTYTTDPKVVAAEEPGEEPGGETGDVTHAGTAADPYTAEECATLGAALSKSSSSGYGDVKEVYVKGIMANNGNDKGNYIQSFNLGSTAGTKSLLVYTANKLKANDANVNAYQNDTVTIHGYLMNYNGTVEISNWKKSDTENLYPEFTAVEAGTSTITVDSATDAKAHVILSANSGKNGSSFTFSVSVDDGFVVDTATVNGTAVKADEAGQYTATVAGNTVVKVTVKDPAAGNPALPYNTSFVADGTWALPNGWTSSGTVEKFANVYTALKSNNAYVEAVDKFQAPTKGISVDVIGIPNGADKTDSITVSGLNAAGEVVATSAAVEFAGAAASNGNAIESAKLTKTLTVEGAGIVGVRVTLTVKNANFVLCAVNVSALA